MSGNIEFTINLQREGATLRATVSRELDSYTEPDLVAAFTQAIDGTTTATASILDLRKLTFIDCSGLRALLVCRDHATQQNASFTLEVDHGPVTRLLDLAEVRHWFTYT